MSWITEEFKSIALGDKRLNDRMIKISEKLSQKSTESIPSACGSWAETKAAYRFFENAKVTPDKILKPHIKATQARIKQHKTVLMVQDTTELNYSTQTQKQGVGPSHREKDLSLLLHPMLAITPNKHCLGVMDNYSWYREELHRETRTRRQVNTQNYHSPIEQKESYRWLLGFQKACRVARACPMTQIIMVGDSECDIFDIYHDSKYRAQEPKANWLIRACHNRALMDETGERKPLLLNEEMSQSPVVGQIRVKLPKRGKRKARKAKISLRIKRLTLHPPTGRRGSLRLSPVTVTAVEAVE